MSMLNKFGKALIHALMRNRKLTDTDSVMNLHDGYYNRLLLPGFVCTDGKPAKLFLWPGSDKDLIISFNGGGCALKPDDCKYPMEFKAFVLNHQKLYTANADEIYEFGFYFIEDNGIHSPMEANPFASWSKVMIPYVSADFHTGTADYPYIDRQGNERILHFNGYKNFLEIMKQIKKRWPAPKRIPSVRPRWLVKSLKCTPSVITSQFIVTALTYPCPTGKRLLRLSGNALKK